jgi:ATP-dependent RNA helicase DDX55/SPB4
VAAPENNYMIPESLTNEYVVVANRSAKLQYLINYLLQHCQGAKVIIFLSTCACVEYYAKLLSGLSYLRKFRVEGIHGKLKPKKRNKIITSFMQKNESSTKGRILLATDVVSRGIDFGDVEFIFQLDPPDDPDNFVHRIGRTARVNRKGYVRIVLTLGSAVSRRTRAELRELPAE